MAEDNKHDETSEWHDANIEVEVLPNDFPNLMDIHHNWLKMCRSRMELPVEFFESKRDTPSAWKHLRWYGDNDSEGE